MLPAVAKQNSCLFYTVNFEGNIKPDDCKDLFTTIKNIDASEYKDQKHFVLVLNQNAQTISPNLCGIICRIASHTEQYEMKFTLIGDLKLQSLLVKNGVERVIAYSSSKADFFRTNGIGNKENVRIFLNALLDSTISTMRVLLELDGIKTEVSILTDVSKVPLIEAGAMAGIISAHFNGNLVIGFSAEVFKKAMTRFLQMDVTDLTAEIKDGAAEFLNVIVGQTKTKLNEVGFEIRQVIPSVIMGEKIEIHPMSKQSCVHIKCITDVGEINIFLSTSATT